MLARTAFTSESAKAAWRSRARSDGSAAGARVVWYSRGRSPSSSVSRRRPRSNGAGNSAAAPPDGDRTATVSPRSGFVGYLRTGRDIGQVLRDRPREGSESETCPAGQIVDLPDDRSPTGELNGASLLLLAQDAIDGRPRCSGHFRQRLLGQWHGWRRTALVGARQLDQASAHPRVGIDVVGLGQARAQTAHLLCQEVDENRVYTRMLALQADEVVAVDRARLPWFEREDGRYSLRVGRDKRQLSKGVTPPPDRNQGSVPERRRDRDAEAPANNEMERVGR